MNDCDRFLAHLDDLLADRLTAGERERLTGHAEQCGDCRASWTICRAEPRADRELTRAILAVTGHDACGAARERLVDRRDGHPEAIDSPLLDEHVEDCRSCRAFASTLEAMSGALPRLAELDPGPPFTSAVVARTSGAFTRRWWRRPRLAMELAYAATMLLAATAAVPGSPLAGGAQQLHRWAADLDRPLLQIETTIHGGMETVVTRTGDGIRVTRLRAHEGVIGRSDRWWSSVRRGLGTLWMGAASYESTNDPAARDRDGGSSEEIEDERSSRTTL